MKQIILALSLVVTVTMSAENKTEHTIETPHGSVTFKETTYPDTEKISPIVRELTKEEHAALQRDASEAARFLAKYATTGPEADYLLSLDTAFAMWLASRSPDKEAEDLVVRVLGA